jgi:hypothetical protein
VAADVTAKYSPGMRVRLVQTTTKYFIITAVSSFSGGNTTITVYGGTNYTLANAAISSPYYSTAKAPYGFPLDPSGWTVTVTDTTQRRQATPTTNTWYNLGSVSISVPIGAWELAYSVLAQGVAGSAFTSTWTTLSTANNTESDADFSVGAGISTASNYVPVKQSKVVAVAAKTSYFINTRCIVSQTDVYNRNDLQKLILTAVCAYL